PRLQRSLPGHPPHGPRPRRISDGGRHRPGGGAYEL
ncbi:MAG: hypothetical protein AVDCRST_MAG01-01-4260, partial [uncultured Rubrobacteraceae bacterium]